MDEVLVVLSGDRANEVVEAVAQSQEQVDALFMEKGVSKGVNPHFPDEYWGRSADSSSGIGSKWTVVRAPFLGAAQ